MAIRFLRPLTALLSILILFGLPATGVIVHAQGGDQPPLEYNVPAIVSLTPGQVAIRTFSVTQGDSFQIRLTRLAEFTCTVVLLDPTQQVTLLTPGPDGVYIFDEPDAPQSGFYSLVIQTSSGTGDLLIQISSITTQPPALIIGENRVSLQASALRYHLTPPPDLPGSTILAISVEPPDVARTEMLPLLPEFTLETAESGAIALAVSAGMLPEIAITLPPQTPFILTFQPAGMPLMLRLDWGRAADSGPQTGQAPSVQLPTSPSVSAAITGTPVTPITAGPCQVSFASAANIRNGPSTAHIILGGGTPGMVLNVIGRNIDSTWWQVNYNGLAAWVSNQIAAVVTQGDCSAIPQASFPPPPTATVTPTGTPTTLPIYTSTPSATATPTITPTSPVVATLNFSLPPTYGSTALTSGFVPDPFTVGITGGGNANVSYLGGGCTGFATSAPSFSVNYTAGAFPTLRFYFIGNVDSTMVINTPGGSYVCVDDSFGTLHPTIDFNSPASGRYDIWIGSFAQGTSVGGTLYVTENTGNHP